MRRALLVAAVTACTCAPATVRGRVVDARGGEPLARVRVFLQNTDHQTNTDDAGRFALDAAPGNYVLQADTVGYRQIKRGFTLSEAEPAEFEIVLSPDTFRRADSVEVHADPFELAAAQPTPAELNLTGTEVKNLSTVLVDDPIRAAHALPGVASNNDFQSQFSLRAAPFSRIGFYLDGVLMHAPFHRMEAADEDPSLSILNGEMVSDIALTPMAFSSRYADRTAGALDVRTREGSRTRPSVRVSSGIASTTALAEGPLGPRKRGSWLVSARRSYIQHIVSRISNDSALSLGFSDAQGKITWDLTPTQTLSIHVLNGDTDVDRSKARERSGLNDIISGANRAGFARAGWRWTASPELIANVTGAWIRERFDITNRSEQPLAAGHYGEWVGNANVTWAPVRSQAFEAGWSARRLRDQGVEYYYPNAERLIQVHNYRGVARRDGGYAQYGWNSSGGRVHATAGLRWDAHEFYPRGVISPHAGIAFRLAAPLELRLGWGQYAQYPELMWLTSPAGGRRLLPIRANHFTAAIEQRITGDTRLRLEAWNRDDRDLIESPLWDPRLRNGRLYLPWDPRLFNSVRGYSRGVQVMLQRRSANRLSGWIGYTFAYSRQRDGIRGLHYWSDWDQRHLLNIWSSYRIRPTLNLSSRWAYGSGEPLRGYYARGADPARYYLSDQPNALRAPDYQRLDLRANKAFPFDRWKLTLYGELLNATNHNNGRMLGLNSIHPRTFEARLSFDRVLPIVPVGGVAVEF
ncbi:MAG TPA: TonB-dependent receptor [Bryobacteraceae bacterium]|nr:TonB-dependent receptor [Bryobacteraceae bacterium]